MFARTDCERSLTWKKERVSGLSYSIPPKGDFKVLDRWLFEIGGKGKGFSQIKDILDSYVVNDGVEIGMGNKMPLWHSLLGSTWRE